MTFGRVLVRWLKRHPQAVGHDQAAVNLVERVDIRLGDAERFQLPPSSPLAGFMGSLLFGVSVIAECFLYEFFDAHGYPSFGFEPFPGILLFLPLPGGWSAINSFF